MLARKESMSWRPLSMKSLRLVIGETELGIGMEVVGIVVGFGPPRVEPGPRSDGRRGPSLKYLGSDT